MRADVRLDGTLLIIAFIRKHFVFTCNQFTSGVPAAVQAEEETMDDADNRLVRQAARALDRAGLVNAYGHCSKRLDSGSFLVSASKPLGLIGPSDRGTEVPIEGPLPAGVLGEVRAHQQIYKRRADVGGICRFLSPKLLSLGAMGRSLKARHGLGAFFAPEPPLWTDVSLLRSDEKAAGMADLLGNSRAIILRANGAITVGETLQQAVVLAWFLEDAARVELDVLNAHDERTAPILSETEAASRASFEGRVTERMWEYLTGSPPNDRDTHQTF